MKRKRNGCGVGDKEGGEPTNEELREIENSLFFNSHTGNNYCVKCDLWFSISGPCPKCHGNNVYETWIHKILLDS